MTITTAELFDMPAFDPMERLVTALDAEAAAGGFFQAASIIVVENGEVSILDLDFGVHPLDVLDGHRAEPSVDAVGFIAFGWAAAHGSGRPSEAEGRQRVRLTLLLARTGQAFSTATFEDGEVIDTPGEGAALDLLHLVMGIDPVA